MLDLIETLLSRYGIRSLRFDGRMDRSARDKCLATFKQAGGPKIILISTKCGSVGYAYICFSCEIELNSRHIQPQSGIRKSDCQVSQCSYVGNADNLI